MKLLIAALAVAIAAASPALAQTKKKQSRDQADAKSWQSQRNAGNWQQTRPARSPNPQWDVYRYNGEYAGSDPDPRIRLMLQMDDPNSDP